MNVKAKQKSKQRATSLQSRRVHVRFLLLMLDSLDAIAERWLGLVKQYYTKSVFTVPVESLTLSIAALYGIRR